MFDGLEGLLKKSLIENFFVQYSFIFFHWLIHLTNQRTKTVVHHFACLLKRALGKNVLGPSLVSLFLEGEFFLEIGKLKNPYKIASRN